MEKQIWSRPSPCARMPPQASWCTLSLALRSTRQHSIVTSERTLPHYTAETFPAIARQHLHISPAYYASIIQAPPARSPVALALFSTLYTLPSGAADRDSQSGQSA